MTAAQHLAPADTTMLVAALDLAGKGWRVLPCWSGGERAKSPIGTVVPNGFYGASADADTIDAWWGRYPTAMIGAVVPGPLMVLDIDPRNGGGIEALEDVLGPLPRTLTAWSGRDDGGRHLYLMRPPGRVSSRRLPTGIDLKVSGYCIVPPSVHPATGLRYRWGSARIATLPTGAVEALRPPRRPVLAHSSTSPRTGAAGALIHAVQDAPEGRRHKVLLWAGCRVFEEGHADVERVLTQLRDAALVAGLSSAEVTTALNWCRAFGAGQVTR